MCVCSCWGGGGGGANIHTKLVISKAIGNCGLKLCCVSGYQGKGLNKYKEKGIWQKPRIEMDKLFELCLKLD